MKTRTRYTRADERKPAKGWVRGGGLSWTFTDLQGRLCEVTQVRTPGELLKWAAYVDGLEVARVSGSYMAAMYEAEDYP